MPIKRFRNFVREDSDWAGRSRADRHLPCEDGAPQSLRTVTTLGGAELRAEPAPGLTMGQKT